MQSQNTQHATLGMVQLRLVGSFKLQVSFPEYSLFSWALLHQIPIILRSLLIVATPQTSNCDRISIALPVSCHLPIALPMAMDFSGVDTRECLPHTQSRVLCVFQKHSDIFRCKLATSVNSSTTGSTVEYPPPLGVMNIRLIHQLLISQNTQHILVNS